MYDLFLKTIEKYHFRDEQGHPIENCEEVKHIFEQMQQALDYYKYSPTDIIVSEKGCPCCGNCCNKPDTGFNHECDVNCEEFCEERYCCSCNSCGSTCYCEL